MLEHRGKYIIVSSLNQWYDHVVKMLLEHYDTEEYADTVFILGGHPNGKFSSYQDKYKDKKFIIYQLEQLFRHPKEKTWQNVTLLVDWLRESKALGATIWDMCIANQAFLETYQAIEVDQVVPLKFTESLEELENKEDPEIDVLFYGNLNPRRAKILSHLSWSFYFKGYKVMWVSNVDFETQKKYIENSKIILNLHHTEDYNRQEQPRIFYAVNNKKCVVSEPSQINYFGDGIVESDDLVGAISHLLEDDRYKAQAQKGYNAFRKTLDDKRIAVYYYFIGDEGDSGSVIPKIPKQSSLDFYYYTQNKKMFEKASAVPNLNCRLVETDSTTPMEHNKAGKWYKLFPHKLKDLQDYDYTVYVDTKYSLNTPNEWKILLTESFIREVCEDAPKFGVFRHTYTRRYIWDEVIQSLEQDRYFQQKDMINHYIYNKTTEGSESYCNPLFLAGFMFRKMNDPVVEEICEYWMDEIEKCGIHDQISFHYVYQKYKEHIKEIVRSSFRDLSELGGEDGREDGQSNWHSFFGQHFHNTTILDVGSGLGHSKARLSVNGNEVTTLDVAPGLVVDLSCSIYDIEDNSYDIVTCFDVIEHIADDTNFLEKLYKIAKKGVVITTPNFTFSQNKNPYHVREYTPAQLLQKCQEHSNDLNFFGCVNPPFSEVFSRTMGSFLLGEDKVLCVYLRKNPADIIL
jgi:2-polyprenyl-3-methyl-5-hydroxy-6-metoxy-1,4-benzoquinol methylase